MELPVVPLAELPGIPPVELPVVPLAEVPGVPPVELPVVPPVGLPLVPAVGLPVAAPALPLPAPEGPLPLEAHAGIKMARQIPEIERGARGIVNMIAIGGCSLELSSGLLKNDHSGQSKLLARAWPFSPSGYWPLT